MRASAFVFSLFGLALFAAAPASAMGMAFHHGGGGGFHPGGHNGHDHHHHDGNTIGSPFYFGDVGHSDEAATSASIPVPFPVPVPVQAPAPRYVSDGPTIIYIGQHAPTKTRGLPKIIYGVGKS